MSTPRNLDAAEQRVRRIYSDLTRAINRCQEQDPALSNAEIVEALQRLLTKHTA